METMTVPDISEGYPSKGKKLGPAWRTAWAALAEADREYLDGKDLATTVAKRHKLVPATIQAVLARAAVAGLLESRLEMVTTTISRAGAAKATPGKRERVHYRIKV